MKLESNVCQNVMKVLLSNLRTGSCDGLQAEVVTQATLFVEPLQRKIGRLPDDRFTHVIGCGTVWTHCHHGSSRNCRWKPAGSKVNGAPARCPQGLVAAVTFLFTFLKSTGVTLEFDFRSYMDRHLTLPVHLRVRTRRRDLFLPIGGQIKLL